MENIVYSIGGIFKMKFKVLDYLRENPDDLEFRKRVSVIVHSVDDDFTHFDEIKKELDG